MDSSIRELAIAVSRPRPHPARRHIHHMVEAPAATDRKGRRRRRRQRQDGSGGAAFLSTMAQRPRGAARLLLACLVVVAMGSAVCCCGAGFVRRGAGPSLLVAFGRHHHQQHPQVRRTWGWQADDNPSLSLLLLGEEGPPQSAAARSAAWGRRRHSFALFMGKGDGKTRKPKKKKLEGATSAAPSSSASASSPSLSSSTPPPRRVSSNINIPVRKQIVMAQLNKQLQQRQSAEASGGASGPSTFRRKVVRTSYRRTWDEQEIQEKAEQRRLRGQDPDWDVVLSRNATLPLMIVDGYNIVHKWSRLKKHMVKNDLARARQLLVDDLENLASLRGWRIEVVFDGGGHRRGRSASPSASASSAAASGTGMSAGAALHAAQGPSGTTARAQRAATTDVSKHGVRVVYTGSGVEADSYIEARCAQAKNVTSGRLTGSFLVATDDQMVRMAGLNAGAMCMGAERFVSELKAVREAVAYRVEAAVAAANGHAVRPDALRRTPEAAARSAAVMARRFGRGSVLIEDKRKIKDERRMRRKEDAVPDLDIKIEVEVDENGIPWWAKVPNQTHVSYRH